MNQNWLGTDEYGRDILSRIIYGRQICWWFLAWLRSGYFVVGLTVVSFINSGFLPFLFFAILIMFVMGPG